MAGRFQALGSARGRYFALLRDLTVSPANNKNRYDHVEICSLFGKAWA